jgi:hypothetical protein
MTAYVEITNGEIDQDSPITQTLMTAYRDNLAAAALEGVTGAPVNQHAWHPYNMVTIGDATTGLFYDFAASGALASIEAPLFVAGYDYRVQGLDLLASSDSRLTKVEFYRSVDAAWSAVTVATSGSPASANTGTFAVEILNPSRSDGIWLVPVYSTQSAYGSMSQFIIDDTVQVISKARVTISSGTLTAGKLWLYRRKTAII